MGHFERGKWVATPTDKLLESCVQLGESLREPSEQLGNSLITTMSTPTDVFRKGRALSLTELAEELIDSSNKIK